MMKLSLKGITGKNTLELLSDLDIYQYSFDLRPKSFNFTQGYNIQKIITDCPIGHNFSLMFEDEKDFVVNELYKNIYSVISKEQKLYLEFTGRTPLADLERYEVDYIWHYHDQEKISNLKEVKFLKKIVFHHEDLEYLNSRGELHGFFNLFSDYIENIFIEIQINWDSDLILSMFDLFQVPMISIEITNQVEVSYQNPDNELIKNQLQYIQNLFTNKKA